MIVVADTSVLLNLSCIGHVDILSKLFHDVFVPPLVAVEFNKLTQRDPRFTGLPWPTWVHQQEPRAVPPRVQSAPGLDPGETAALALALEIHADAILVDERRGHEVAILLGLRPIGLLGILLQAKQAGVLSRIAPLLEDLHNRAGFWMSEQLHNRILHLAGEVI